MEFIADLHVHSKYSRAVSQQMVLPQMAIWAAKKGLSIITTGDWTHPLWLREIKAQLKESSEGLYQIKNPRDKNKDGKVRFILSVEIASIYKQGEKLRRIHSLVFAPNLEIVEKINQELRKRGCNLSSDGRPITGLSVRQLLELVLAIDEKIIFIPCHVWTPHFGIYGSASGFDSLEEAFGDLNKFIYAVETGLSSDPIMNWQIEELKNRSILSFSDAHSLPKIGREATVFVTKNGISDENISYEDIRLAIMRKSPKLRIGYTIEFYPEEGKYHFSGHRNCKVVKGVSEIKKEGEICPVCKRKLTEGVLHRVTQLSRDYLVGLDKEKESASGIKWYIDKTRTHPPFVKLVPLNEIIAEALESTVASEKVKNQFDDLCRHFGSEVLVLLRTPIAEIQEFAGEKIAQGIAKVRRGDIIVDPGYDGVYGKVRIWSFDSAQDKNEVEKTQLNIKF